MTTETTENTEAVANTGLDITDIQLAVALLDYAANEGAFRGWEIINKAAGCRTRFAAFLEMVAAAQKNQADAEAAANPAPTGPDAEHALAPGA